MRRTVPLALTAAAVATLLASAPAHADDLGVASKIARVTVYEDRALVERTATVTLPAGTTRLVFRGLPAGVDATALRARSPQAKVLGADVETVPLASEALPAAEAARKEWDLARRVLSLAKMDLDDAKDAWDRLKSVRASALGTGADGLGGAPLDAKSVERMLDLVEEQGRKARRTIIDAETAHEQARSAEDAARRRFEQMSAAAQRSETRAIVTVTAAEPAEASISLSYLLGNAGWTPAYDLRVNEDFGGMTLEMHALVRQATGEDWRDVAMELTTAQPSAGAAPPEPSPWTIDLLREPRDGAVSKRAAPGLAAPLMDAAEEKSKDAGFEAPVRRSGVTVAFGAALPATVAPDGKPVRVALGRFEMKPDVRWTAFPRATDKVFVTAKTRNTLGTALPGGEARVFVGPDFVGAMALEDWGQEKEIDVGLGADREVEVARESLKHERSTEGVFSKDTVHARSWRITVKNHRDRGIDLRLLDQVPVSRDEDLKVEITENSHALATLPAREAEDNKARGVLEWRLPVAQRGEADVRFSFKVTHPRDRTVLGMDE